jgi:hypothetical protein
MTSVKKLYVVSRHIGGVDHYVRGVVAGQETLEPNRSPLHVPAQATPPLHASNSTLFVRNRKTNTGAELENIFLNHLGKNQRDQFGKRNPKLFTGSEIKSANASRCACV